MKPLPEAVDEFSAQREGAAVLVIQVTPAAPGSGHTLNCEEYSCSGQLAERYSAGEVLQALVATLDATLRYYRGLQREASGQVKGTA